MWKTITSLFPNITVSHSVVQCIEALWKKGEIIEFLRLTVEEHLWFYARLKGQQPESVQTQSEQMVVDLGNPFIIKQRNTVVLLRNPAQEARAEPESFRGNAEEAQHRLRLCRRIQVSFQRPKGSQIGCTGWLYWTLKL